MTTMMSKSLVIYLSNLLDREFELSSVRRAENASIFLFNYLYI